MNLTRQQWLIIEWALGHLMANMPTEDPNGNPVTDQDRADIVELSTIVTNHLS